MKKLKNDLKAVAKQLAALTRKTEGMANKVAKLEKAQAKANPKKAAAKKALQARKTKAKAKTARKAVSKKKAASQTATDQVLNIIKRSKNGVDVAALMKKSGLAEKTIRNVLFRVGKQNKIKRAGRGVYVGA